MGICLRNRETKIQIQYIKQLTVSALRCPERVVNIMLKKLYNILIFYIDCRPSQKNVINILFK